MSIYRIFNGLLYTFGWLFCVVCGAHGYKLPPIFLTLVVVVGQLLYLRGKNHLVYTNDLAILCFGALLGFFMEVIMLSIGLIQYATVNIIYSAFPPGWVWCLYFLFSLTYNHSLKFLDDNRLYPYIFGAIGGPISYYAGSRLGAVIFLSIISLPILALFWGGYISFMVWINNRLRAISQDLFSRNHLEKPLTVYFDTVCPMCNKELKHLKTRKQTGHVIYFEIKSPEQFNEEVKGIDYFDAMKEIHAMDGDGHIFRGVDAFVELYSRTNLDFLALILKAPISSHLFKILYKFWAKYRLNNRCKIQSIKRC